MIDEARTPLIISGPTEDLGDLYAAVNVLIAKLDEDDYEKDEKGRTATYTDPGIEKMEDLMREAELLEEGSLFDIQNVSLVHHANQALRAHVLFERDVDYIVKDDQVIIIDEFTGRMQEGRRYSEGLHQALEAKEGVKIQNENQTLASITFQNYFRLYPKLAGMTGTAMTEAGEFAEIYKLEVVEIPTNVDISRIDHDDEVYRSVEEKYEAIALQIKDCFYRKQPVLVGTVSIEKSEQLSEMLKKSGVEHSVLNARYHEQEAQIISQAGRPGGVTIATNMAGRGTDIQLGGNFDMRLAEEVKVEPGTDAYEKASTKLAEEIQRDRELVLEAGGLFVLGTERHESRRIDNQLRGRSGRQGDPGTSKFYLSLKDDLMRIFGSERIDGMLQKLGLQEGEAIVHPWVNKALEKAQSKVEARNFEIRKNLLKFDDVMNDQRKVIYEQRRELMAAENVAEDITDMRQQVVSDMVSTSIPEKAYADQWDTELLHDEVQRVFGLDVPVQEWAKEEGIADEEIRERLTDVTDRMMAEKAANVGPDVMRMVEKSLLLQLLDQNWKEHLLTLDHLRQGIGLRAYAQRDPLNEYKREAFDLFEEMLEGLRDRVTTVLAFVQFEAEPEPDAFARLQQQMTETRTDPALQGSADNSEGASDNATVTNRQAQGALSPDDPSTWGRMPRNAPCPCGSGKKYKHCHGKAS